MIPHLGKSDLFQQAGDTIYVVLLGIKTKTVLCFWGRRVNHYTMEPLWTQHSVLLLCVRFKMAFTEREHKPRTSVTSVLQSYLIRPVPVLIHMWTHIFNTMTKQKRAVEIEGTKCDAHKSSINQTCFFVRSQITLVAQTKQLFYRILMFKNICCQEKQSGNKSLFPCEKYYYILYLLLYIQYKIQSERFFLLLFEILST